MAARAEIKRSGTETRALPDTIRAAAYVRMSTDLQQYSTENQLAAIMHYADRRGLEIAGIYEDAGKSGLKAENRSGLQRLMTDVARADRGFEVIVAYDVSRWGRFQDADESAYYEHICSRAGVRVHYCAEQFENDGSLTSNVVKSIKRLMAGEYSRDLSTKVFAGQCRLVEKGFRQGGAPGYGLRRMLLDDRGTAKGLLKRNERKSLQTDRVVLVPGPDEEVATVRRIYRQFLVEGSTETEIAKLLNADGIPWQLGKPWNRQAVREILVNPKYVGDNVYNRFSCKLQRSRVRNRPEDWVKAKAVFTPLVDCHLQEAALAQIAKCSTRYSDEQLLLLLKRLLGEVGALSGIKIDECNYMPSSRSYGQRFGSLLRAYRLIGYHPQHDFRYVEANRELRRRYPSIVDAVTSGVLKAGGAIHRASDSELLKVNDEFTLSVAISRCVQTASGKSRWQVSFDVPLRPDITVAVRMNRSNSQPLDYYLFPRTDISGRRLFLTERNGLALDGYRFDSLEFLYALASRANPWRRYA